MGDNAISGTADGADAVVERAQLIASYGLDFELLHLLVSRENMALSRTTPRAGRTPCWTSTWPRSAGSATEEIASIETYLSDVPGMNAFFV
nr:hypothetical protein [Streptomyces sp. RK75]